MSKWLKEEEPVCVLWSWRLTFHYINFSIATRRKTNEVKEDGDIQDESVVTEEADEGQSEQEHEDGFEDETRRVRTRKSADIGEYIDYLRGLC